MWFQFATNEHSISVERQVFNSEWKNSQGESFFRAPTHFMGRLVQEGGCKPLAIPPEGVPDLPEIVFHEPKADGTDAKVTMLEALLSDEKTTSSALRAELAAKLHENDSLKLQVHELREELNETKANAEDSGVTLLEATTKRR